MDQHCSSRVSSSLSGMWNLVQFLYLSESDGVNFASRGDA